MLRDQRPVQSLAIPARAREFHVGQRIVYRDSHGAIVANLSTGEYASPGEGHRWRALGAGILIRWDDGTLGHFLEPDGQNLRPDLVETSSSLCGPPFVAPDTHRKHPGRVGKQRRL